MIAVEAKADESFGATLAATSRAASKRKAENPRSKGLDRLERLAEVVLGVPGDPFPPEFVGDLFMRNGPARLRVRQAAVHGLQGAT